MSESCTAVETSGHWHLVQSTSDGYRSMTRVQMTLSTTSHNRKWYKVNWWSGVINNQQTSGQSNCWTTRQYCRRTWTVQSTVFARWRQCAHHLIMLPWAQKSPQPKWQLDRFSGFCRANDSDGPTDHAFPSVTTGRIYVLWCGLKINKTRKALELQGHTDHISNIFPPVTLNFYLWPWSTYGHSEPPCQISSSKVICKLLSGHRDAQWTNCFLYH